MVPDVLSSYHKQFDAIIIKTKEHNCLGFIVTIKTLRCNQTWALFIFAVSVWIATLQKRCFCQQCLIRSRTTTAFVLSHFKSSFIHQKMSSNTNARPSWEAQLVVRANWPNLTVKSVKRQNDTFLEDHHPHKAMDTRQKETQFFKNDCHCISRQSRHYFRLKRQKHLYHTIRL